MSIDFKLAKELGIKGIFGDSEGDIFKNLYNLIWEKNELIFEHVIFLKI